MALTKVGKEGITGISNSSNATAITIDASENVGIGVVPESSYPDRPVLRIGSGLGLMCRASGNPSHTWINSNAYQDPSSADDKYISADEASQIRQTNGSIHFMTAASGSANATISWTNAMSVMKDGGITFNGDTAAANALDDYEEGTWTPAFTANGATFGYSVQKGSYVKIGALVTLWYNITLSSISTSANSVFISGLPFSTYSISDLYAGGGLGAYANINLGTGTTLAYQLPAASGTQIELKEIGDNMGENGVVASELASNTFIRGSIFYRAA